MFCFIKQFVVNGVYYSYVPCGKTAVERTIISYLTLREIEYLNVVKKASLTKYGDLLTRLKQQRFVSNKMFDATSSMELDKFISSIN